MFGNGFTEGLALHRVVKRHIGRPFGHAGASGGNINPPELESSRDLLEPFAFFAAHQIVGRHPEILENQLCTVDGSVTQFL